MADERVSIEIDVESIKVDKQKIEEEVNELDSSLSQSVTPDVVQMYNPMFQNLRSQIASIGTALEDALSGKNVTSDIASRLNSSLSFLRANLASVKASANEVKEVFDAIPKETQAEFSKTVVDTARAAQRVVNQKGGSVATSRSVSGHATSLMQDEVFGKAYAATAEKYGLNESQSTKLLAGITRRIVPAMRNDDIVNAAIRDSKGSMQREDFVPAITNFRQRMPERYRNLPSDFSPTKKIPESKKAMYEGDLTHEEYNKVKMIAEHNSAFERSLARAGVARRGFAVENGVRKAGVLQMPAEPISRKQYAEALGYMVTEELVPALEGAPAFYHPIASMKAEDQKAIAAKNSKTPAAVYSAMSDLDTINVDPILMPKGSSSQSTFTGPAVALTGKGVHVNPDMYQIQSLTYEDFVGGKVLDTKAETQSVFDDKAAGRSVNKIIYQSGYTDLLGLHGNLSNGEGGKENSASPIMMQIDMSDAIRKKDADGNIVFENGAPVIDETAKDLVAKMFEKTETYTYTRNGKEETYQYPMATFGENGVRYVPTNVKDGKITLAREADYLAAAKPWLEELGVNPFDAFESFNGEYADVNKFSKAFDMRNRNNTPSVPIASLGGAMPKSNQIAFIDDSVIKGLVPDNQAYDGAFFVMPGYIPGEAGVVRAPGLKGGAVSVNFKQMLKDLYGDQEILLPGINAPDAAKEEFLANGMQGVRAKFSEDEISKYFINPMNYEALMTDSVLKASIYKRGDTQEEMQQTFDTIMRLSGGLRMHKTAADFWSSQNSLSSQVSEKLDLTPEELVANQEAWDNYITRLEHDQEFIIDTLFSDETDPLSMRIRNNPALLNQDPEAQLRIQNSIDSAKISRGYGEIFARKNANMGFAAPNVGEFLMRAGAMNNATVADEDLAKILQMKEIVTDDDGTESILKHIAVPKLADVSAFGALRYPNNQGEQYYFENDKAYIDLLKKYGMSQDAVYMNANDLYKMGTGDFDGDTVQMLQGKLANIIRRTEMHRGNLMDRQTRTSEDLEHPAAPMNRQANGGDVADLLYRQATAMFQMGAVSNANDALSQVNMNDPKTATKWAAAAKDLELMYDIDSVFPKTGTLADWTSEAAQARKIGTPFAKLFKNLQGIVDNPTEESYRELGNFSKVNFPSVYNGLTASMLTSISKNPMTSGAVDKMIEAQADLQNIPALEASSKKYDQAQAAFLKLNNKTMANILTRGAIPSKETVEDLENSLGAWEAALSSKEGGFPGWKGRKDEARTEEERAAVSAYNFQKSRIAFLKSMGISEASREEGKGYAGFGFYKDNSLDIDTSVFQSAFDAEKDAQAIRIATSSGAAPDSLKATQLAAQIGLKKQSPLRIAAAKAKEKQMKYSYSMLNMFANEPEKWYDRYVNEHYDNTNTPDALLGSVVHKVQEIWANDRIAAGGYDGARSADEYERIFRGILSGDADIYAKYVDPKKEEASFKQLASMIGYDAKTGKFDTKATGKGFANKFNNSLDYIRNLPEMMKGLQIVGAEVKTRPEFGDAQDANVGSIDLLAWDPNTESYVIADTKAKKDPTTISHAKKQIMLYNSRGGIFVPASAERSEPAHFEYNDAQKDGKRPATRGMILSYGVDTKGDPSRSVTEFDINEEENAKIEAEYQERKREVAAYAARGFDRDEIEFGTYRMPNPDSERDVPSKITYSKKPKSPKKPSTKTEGNQPDEQQNQPDTQHEAQATVPPVIEIDPHSGRAVAQEITLQQDIDAYLEKMRGAQSQLISTARKADNPRVPNKWLGYEFMLNQDYDTQMQKFNAMGLAADDPRRAELVKAREDAQGAFDHALSESAVKDIERKKEELEQRYSKGEIDSSTASFTKEYDAISNSVSEATQALDFYKKKTEEIRTERAAIKGDLSVDSDESINAQLDVGEATLAKLADEGKFGTDEYKTVEDANGKLIQRLEERKALVEKLKTLDADLASRDKNIEAGDAAAKELEETKQNKLKYLQDKATDHFSNQLRGMERLTTGEEMSAEEIAAAKGEDLENKIESFKKGIALSLEKGLISQDTADQMLAGISNIDVDAYKRKTKEEINYQKEQEEKAYQYKQQKTQRERNDEIESVRERNQARREGKPVDKSKHEERQYESKLAELEEQRRRLEDQAMNDSETVENRTRAMDEAIAQEEYIKKVKSNHDETLRVDAFADLRDFNEKLSKENNMRGADSIATGYIQQFEALEDAIKSATAKYDELKKKVESKKHSQKDVDALAESESQVKILGKNAKIKRDSLKEQFDESFLQKLGNLQHLASGTEYTPAEIAQLKKSSLQKQIDEFIQGQNLIAGNAKLPKSVREAAKTRVAEAQSIDLDKYEQTIYEQEQFEAEQKKQQEQARIKRVYRQADKHARDPFGTRRNSLAGRIDETKQGALDQYESDAEQLKTVIAKQKNKLSHTAEGTDEYEELSASLKEAEERLKAVQDAASGLEGPMGTAAAATAMLAQSAQSVAIRFGKQLFQKALAEAKQFVVQWDSSMTEIRMVTGKTQEEISSLSEELMQTAVDMKVSPTDVGSAAVDLYRQGLSDEEVSVRMEDVLKFSKVAGISVEQASKMLTTAVSNDLVSSTQEAMDAMVALGDSAATTAEDISKGMQKSAAAAKEAGVSYEQLLTMLTIITSKTQLGGANAGTTLQTLFNRMYRVTSGQDFYDENGNRIAATTTSNALKSVGVSMFDETGNYRGAYDILMDLAKGWEGYSDTDRNLILNTLGAGRQSSNIATLLQGLGEDNGELADKYMNLATGSKGITDEKYVAYLESLNAALQNVKTAFDAFIESLSTTGVATDFLNFIANLIQGLTSVSNATGGFTNTLLVLIPVITAVGVAIAAATGKLAIAGAALNINPIFAAISAFALVATAIGAIGNALDSVNQKEDPFETLTKRYSEIDDKKTTSLDSIDRLEQLAKKENRTTAETNELNEGLAKLNVTLGRTGTGADNAAFTVDNFADSCDEAKDSVNALAEAEALLTAQGKLAEVVSGTEDKLYAEETLEKNLRGEVTDSSLQTRYKSWGNGFRKTSSGQIQFGQSLSGNYSPYYDSSSIYALPNKYTVEDYVSDSFAEYILSNDEATTYLEKYNLLNLVTDPDSLKEFLSVGGDFTKTYNKGNYGAIVLKEDSDGTVHQAVGDNADRVIYAAQDVFYQNLYRWYSEYLNGNQGRTQNLDIIQQDAYDFIYGLVSVDADLDAAEAMLFSLLYSEDMRKGYEGLSDPDDIIAQYGADLQILTRLISTGDGKFDTGFIRGYVAENKKDYIVDLQNNGQDTGLSYEEAVANAMADRNIETSTGYSFDGKTFYNSEDEAARAMADSYGTTFYKKWAVKSRLADNVDAVDDRYWERFVTSLQNSRAIKPSDVYSYNGQLYTTDQLGEVFVKEGIIHRASDDEAEYEASETGRSEKAFRAITSSNTNYQTTNSSKFEADALYEAIVSNGISSWQDLFNAIAENKLPTLENVVNSNPGTIGAMLSNFVDFDSETGQLKIKNGATDADLLMLLSQIAAASESYTSAGTMSDLFSGKQTKETWDRFKEGAVLTELSADNLKKAVGDDVFAELQWIDNKTSIPTVETLMQEKGLTEEDAQKEVEKIADEKQEEKTQILEAGGYTRYIDMLAGNEAYGIDGLLAIQQNELQQSLFKRILSGNVSDLSESMRSVYSGDNTDLSSLSNVAYNLEQKGLSISDLVPEADGYEEATKIIEEMGYSIDEVQDKLASLNKELAADGVRAAKKYGDQSEKVAEAIEEWGTTAESTRNKQKSLRQEMTAAMNRQYYRDQYKSGDRSEETLSQISEMTGYDTADLESGKYTDQVLDFLDELKAEDMQGIANEVDALFESLAADQNIDLGSITANGGDISSLIDALVNIEGAVSDNVQAYLEYLQSQGFEGHFETTDTGMHFVIDKMPGKKSGGGGGGGGGGSKKSAATKLIEEQDRETTLRDHIIKMIQYEETRYENLGELTNYGIMLQHEIDEEERQTGIIEANIEALKRQMAATQKGSDDWYALRDAILKAEEALSEMNNTIDANKKKQEENNQAILKTHTDLEQEVKGEIETRISEERDMLDGQVSMEQTILNAIRNRYEEEWKLMQKDIDKKKKALQEEMELIDERLQRRKNAEDEAEKYEELAEYKRQLALISTDSTRTKDQAALREKIADLEKELAWDKAEEEADLQKEGIQDQIDAYDEYVDDYQEYLDDLLENANNFADEVNSVMQMSHEDMIAWLQQNVEEYKNSLEASQKQMTQGWDDTFKQMKGIIDTFWEEVAQHLSSKDNFLEYMKQSSAYQNASEDEKAQMLYNWGTMYDAWVDASKVDPDADDYDHKDPPEDGSGKGSEPQLYGVSTSEFGGFNSGRVYKSKSEARQKGIAWLERKAATYKVGVPADKQSSIDVSLQRGKDNLYVYKTGGLVDYTGPAWVDGTKSRPEAFLSADDTQMIRTLIDGWKYVATRPTMTNLDGLMQEGSGNTIGDVYVTLNEAQFNTDEDYELVAQKVGEAFTKELAKNGFSTAAYRF